MAHQHSPLATMAGVLALGCWACSAAIACEIKTIPVLQVLCISQAIGFLVTVLRIGVGLGSFERRQPIWSWIARALFFAMCQASYFTAFRYAPADHVDLINYTWPMLVAVTSGFLPSERFSNLALVGVVLGFSGIWVLNAGDPAPMTAAYAFGCCCAFASALSWVAYVLLCRWKRSANPSSAGVYCGISALLFTGAFFWQGQEWVEMSAADFSLIAALGVFCNAGAFPLWDYGVKHGNFQLLTAMSYLTPVVSVYLLVVLGYVESTGALASACALVLAGTCVSSYAERKTHVEVPVTER